MEDTFSASRQYKKAIINLAHHIENSKDKYIKIVKEWDAKECDSIMKNAQKYAEELNLNLDDLRSKTKWQCKSTINTDRTIIASKPDIIFQDKKTNKLYIIDIAIPADTNIVKKKIEKIDTYIDLSIDLKRQRSPGHTNSYWCNRSDIEEFQTRFGENTLQNFAVRNAKSSFTWNNENRKKIHTI